MGCKVLRFVGPTYDVLYLIFLLLLPVSRTSPTSRTSLDRPVLSRASCSSTVRNLQTGTGRHDSNEATLKLPGSVHGSARFVPPSHRFGSRSSSFAAAPAKTQNKTAIDSCVRSICRKVPNIWTQLTGHIGTSQTRAADDRWRSPASRCKKNPSERFRCCPIKTGNF